MNQRIQLDDGSYFVLKDSRFIHVYVIIDGTPTELAGFQSGEAVNWSKTDNDVTVASDFKGVPLGLINHSKLGQFVAHLNDGAPAHDIIYGCYFRQMNHSSDVVPTFGFKVENDNNGEVIKSSICLIQKMPNGSVSNGITSRDWTILALQYDDSFGNAA